MGVALTPIVVKQTLALDDLAGRTLAVDGNAELYQFLALIRGRDGSPLMTRQGRITSHLVGLFYRTTRLMAEHGIRLAFVFDGVPPVLKQAELARRREVRQRFTREAEAARAAGDLERAYATATMSSRLTREMTDEAMQLLRLLGVPVVQAPGEGEAQAALMARRGDVWAAASKDYDTLLFGTPRLLRFLSISGKEFLPSQGTFRPIVPELIETDALLEALGIDHAQLVDLAILVGTDFNDGVHGVGAKKALKLVRQFGRIEAMPAEIASAAGDVAAIRAVYADPDVSTDYALEFGPVDEAGVLALLSGEFEFSPDRVRAALDRVRARAPG
jgi:flap endonuclease-1